jgi:hypothetical protein
VLADLIPADGCMRGAKPTSIDAGIYGFIANIHFFPTPLKRSSRRIPISCAIAKRSMRQ